MVGFGVDVVFFFFDGVIGGIGNVEDGLLRGFVAEVDDFLAL